MSDEQQQKKILLQLRQYSENCKQIKKALSKVILDEFKEFLPEELKAVFRFDKYPPYMDYDGETTFNIYVLGFEKDIFLKVKYSSKFKVYGINGDTGLLWSSSIGGDFHELSDYILDKID